MMSNSIFKDKIQTFRLKYFVKRTIFQSNTDSSNAFDSPSNQPPNFESFAQESSIHGLRFLSKRGNSNYSRIFWSLSLFMSLIGLFYNAKRLYIKLNVSPDIGLSVKQELAREVPFPAITICMPVYAKSGLADFPHYVSEYNKNGFKNGLNLTGNEERYMLANILRCSINRMPPVSKCCNNRTVSNIVKLLDESALSIDEALTACSLKLVSKNCRTMYNRILTDKGFCFTTNMQSIDTIYKTEMLSEDLQTYMNQPQKDIHWTLDNGFFNDLVKEAAPLRLTKANFHITGTSVSPENAANVCNLKNILVRIHLPNEIPTMFHNGFQIEHGHEKRLKIKAKATKAHSSLRSYSPQARGCYFEGEKELEYFKIYTKYHCYLECLALNVIEKCGCASFYMPRNSSVRICDIYDANCVHESSYEWPDEDDLKDGSIPCDCYPTCNDIEYSVSEIDFIYDSTAHADRIKNYSKSMLYSRICVYFEDHAIQLNEKYVAYKFQNFIADLGGLLGLFLGCSLLSMIEVLYFICMVIKDKYFGKELKIINKPIDPTKNHEEFLKTLKKIDDDVYIIRAPLYERRHKRISY